MGCVRQEIDNRGFKRDPFKDSTNERLRAVDDKKRQRRNNLKFERMEDPKYRREKYDIRNNSRKIAYAKQRQSLFKILGGAFCTQCHYDDYPEALQIDHIFNTGNLDKLRFKRRDQLFRYYISHPLEAIEVLQILCANCNQVKIWNREFDYS